MRVAVPLALLLAAMARQGCGGDSPSSAPYFPCNGKTCGDACTVCAPGSPDCVETAVQKACNPHGECDPVGTFICPGESCDGKPCGVRCDAECPLGAPCPAPRACDGLGRCAPLVNDLCPPGPLSCAGKACGASCIWDPPCRGDTPPCMMPSAYGHCSGDGTCVPGSFAGCAPDPACAGKACGDACDLCGGACMNPVAMACDYAGRCAPVSPWICYDACAGLTCGAQCHTCPPNAVGCVEPALYMACDATGICSAATPVSCP